MSHNMFDYNNLKKHNSLTHLIRNISEPYDNDPEVISISQYYNNDKLLQNTRFVNSDFLLILQKIKCNVYR